MDYCEVCDVDLGGTCDQCGKRACDHCINVCNHCGDTSCSDCYNDEEDMCLTCKESKCEGEKEDDDE